MDDHPLDFSTVALWIEGQPHVWEGLRRRREALEKTVAPWLASRKTATADTLIFKGKRRYLKPRETWSELTWRAVDALQHLYCLESAARDGDVDQIAEHAIGFAHADNDVQNIERFGVASMEAILELMRKGQVRRDTRLGKTKLKDVSDVFLQAAYAKHYGHRTDWMKAIREDIREKYNRVVSLKVIGRELDKRGVRDTSTKVRGHKYIRPR